MTVIDTSTAATATAYSNQRKIDRCSNGVLWALGNKIPGAFAWEFWYSTDDGATWTFDNNSLNSGSSDTYTANGSIFIDVDDYMHFVYKDGTDGYIYYRRGTPNAGRTDWTWSAATTAFAATFCDYPDIVAFREPTGGWRAAIVVSYLSGSAYTAFTCIPITSGGSIGTPFATPLGGLLGPNDDAIGTGVGKHTYPSIDFNHTGDGKTVAGSTPHLYAAWSGGTTGAGYGVRFRKATYSGGSWTWGTDQEIDSTRYISNTDHSLRCAFDGTRAVIDGWLYTGSEHDYMIYDRDAADTTTTTREVWNNTGAVGLLYPSSTFDADGNVWIVAWRLGNTIAYRRWVRSSNTLEGWVDIDTVNMNGLYPSVKRGYSNGFIEFIYITGSPSPYDVTYGQIELASGAFVGWGIPMGIA